MKRREALKRLLQRVFLLSGFVLCLWMLLLAARVLASAPIGSHGALERRVAGYIETGLCCAVIQACAAAVLELIDR